MHLSKDGCFLLEYFGVLWKKVGEERIQMSKSLTPKQLIALNRDMEYLVTNLQGVAKVSNFAYKLFSIMDTPSMLNMKKIAESINKFCDKPSWDTSIIKANLESLENFEETIMGLDMEELNQQMAALHKIKYSSLLANSSDLSKTINNIISVAYDISQSYSSNKNSSEREKLETQFANQSEIVESFIEQAENPVGFQKRVANWAEEKWKKYKYFVYILYAIWSNFGQPYFQQNIGIPVTAYLVSNVKELPEKAGKVICQLEKDIEAIIIEDTNYYYKVNFIDKDGFEREGYVAKKNLKVIDIEN